MSDVPNDSCRCLILQSNLSIPGLVIRLWGGLFDLNVRRDRDYLILIIMWLNIEAQLDTLFCGRLLSVYTAVPATFWGLSRYDIRSVARKRTCRQLPSRGRLWAKMLDAILCWLVGLLAMIVQSLIFAPYRVDRKANGT